MRRRRSARRRLSDVRAARERRREAGNARAVLAVARIVCVAPAPQRRPPAAASRAGVVRVVGGAMIVLFNPVSTSPGKQPLPLSLMSLAAVLERGWVDSDSEVGVK